MKDLLQKLKSSGPARLTLAAFGKHPGWDDHIPAIGVSTETLAYVEKTLYDKAIRGQIDSGAWEKGKLDQTQRLQGYDHLLCWSRAGHLILGQLWSSTDGKGRLNYPMVLCVDGEGVSSGFLVRTLAPGLDRIKESCRSAASSDAVIATCRAAQEQLRNLLIDPSVGSDPGLAAEARRAFMDHAQLGPNRLGLLRVLHELNSLTGSTGGSRSRHLRVPLAADSLERGILLWLTFLRTVLPESCPILLLARRNTNWLDLIAGEPAAEDFFCFQASAQALPLTSEIPYEIGPDLPARLRQIESKFVGEISAPIPRPAEPSAATAAAPAQPSAIPEAPRIERGSPAAPTQAASAAAPAARTSGKPILVALAALFVLAAAGAAAYLFTNHSNKPATSSSTPNSSTNSPAANAQYQRHLEAARAAFQSKDFSNAIIHAQAALQSQPADPAATRLAEDARKALDAAAQEQNYKNATNAAVAALEKQQFAEATNQASLALRARPGDPVASDLMLRAQQGMNVAIVGDQKKSDYIKAATAATNALARKDFHEAANQASLALTNWPGDRAATDLLGLALRGLREQDATAKSLQQYQDATNAAGLALQKKEYQETIAQASKAAALRPDDPAATSLKARGEEGLAANAAQSLFDQGNYSQALAICKKYSNSQTLAALSANIIAEQKSANAYSQKFSAGDYAFVKDLQSRSYSSKSPFASLLTQAQEEQTALADLTAFKAATNWTAIQTNLAGYSADRAKKAPFSALASWADDQAKSAQLAGKKSLGDLDADLEVLLVTFGMLKATDPQIQSDKARKTKPLRNIIESDGQVQAYLKQVRDLQSRYRDGNWLSQNNRDRNLKDLERAIINWNN
jgi:hypothetical protein